MNASPVNDERGSAWVRFEPPLMLTGGDLDQFLSRALPGARAVGVEYLEGGVVNSNYRVDVVLSDPAGAPPVSMLVRLSRSDEGPLRSAAVADAVRNRISCDVPRLFFSETGERPEAHRRSLFGWIPGEGLDSRGIGDGERLLQSAHDLGRSLSALHSISFPGFGRLQVKADSTPGLAGPPASRWADDVARRTAARLDNPAHGLDREAHDRLRREFARLLAPFWTRPIPAAIVHGDLSPGNIILGRPVSGGPLRLSGLIDWEMARAADPAHDFASLRFEVGRGRPGFVTAVEAAYRRSPEAGPDSVPSDEWEARVRLASVPILLDARMVAHRRRSPAALEEIDRLLDAALQPLDG